MLSPDRTLRVDAKEAKPCAMLRLAAAFVLCLVVFVHAVHAAPPQRIVSLNLCADQYLLALADRSQIAALTQLATDPGMSAMADLALGLPQISGAAEEVIALNPDLILGGTYSLRATRELLERVGYRTLALPPDESFASIRATARRLAGLIGHPERGERLVAALDEALSAASSRDGVAPSALYYQRRGFASGSRSLVSEIMAAAGLRNLAADLGIEQTARVDLEKIVAMRPAYLVLDSLDPKMADQGSYMLRHPALLHVVPRSRQLVLPRPLVTCGGPMTAEAVRRLAAQVHARE